MSCTQPIFKFRKLSTEAIAPIKITPHSARFDLTSPRIVVIPPQNWLTVFVGISIQLPPRCYGRLAPRSGLAALQGITVDAGVINRDYTGNLGVVLVNRSRRPYTIHAGDRIAQLICEKIEYPILEEIKDLPQSTKRGFFGFGSSRKGYDRI